LSIGEKFWAQRLSLPRFNYMLRGRQNPIKSDRLITKSYQELCGVWHLGRNNCHQVA